ncbi:hypothetical protein SDC9_68028 [bioreactor metagenome]|uniref:Uncharacterized protein n=1 Tax=bioreactor metagenome TaxID=1076179 RepID=A0A644Y5X9_9ZZZZ
MRGQLRLAAKRKQSRADQLCEPLRAHRILQNGARAQQDAVSCKEQEERFECGRAQVLHAGIPRVWFGQERFVLRNPRGAGNLLR